VVAAVVEAGRLVRTWVGQVRDVKLFEAIGIIRSKIIDERNVHGRDHQGNAHFSIPGVDLLPELEIRRSVQPELVACRLDRIGN
jgi:hypothetical protein